jgi:hypothetical protein
MENKRKSKFDIIKEENSNINLAKQQILNSPFSMDLNNLNNQQMHNTIDQINEFNNPETISVGIMATIVKNQIKRNKESNKPFVPYQHIEISNLKSINTNQALSQSVLTKLEIFYKFYDKIK